MGDLHTIPEQLIFNLTAGNLFPQLSGSKIWSTLPDNTTNPNISTIINKNDIQLTYQIGNGNSSLALPLVAMLLQPNATVVPVRCTYPLSGQYDVLPRFLFYLTLTVAILFRRFKWLAGAALGVAITYSTISAIHFFILLARFTWFHSTTFSSNPEPWNVNDSRNFGDIDFFGIIPVLSAAAVMLSPIITWSSTFRAHRARPLVVLWGLLIFAALIPALLLLYRFVEDLWGLNSPPSFAYCTGTLPKCRWDSMARPDSFDLELYTDCNCVDFCSLLSPKAPLRANMNMSVDLKRQISAKVKLKGRYRRFFIVIMIVWGVATAHGMLNLLFSAWAPTKTRNTLFNALYARPLALLLRVFEGSRRQRIEAKWNVKPNNARGKTGLWWRFRSFVAASIAGTVYLLAMAGALIYPLTFGATIVVNELLAAEYPVSEHSDAIGAWSPWLGLGLVLIASIVMGWHSTVAGSATGIATWMVNFIRYDADERTGLQELVRQHRNSKLDPDEKEEENLLTALPKEISLAWRAMIKRMEEFFNWWRDPVTGSAENRDEGVGLVDLPKDAEYAQLSPQRGASPSDSITAGTARSP
ncbi:hypothetical protein BT63DRAFT_421870 [Microthyrium microscopicum]|uniref:Uncharacterized protein n=1 Tax=Microthyrium microscopicum TaxID=703497 RepID=A0A6A6UN89_9PEZI|nr:hypothetical protein BT63DRAFT_421870 [Microthyrium microscopicum]